MSRFLRLSLLVTAILLIIACGLSASPSATTNSVAEASPVSLAIQPETNTFTTLGQSIKYNFVVTNTGTTALVGPVTVTDDKMTVQCPNLTDVGDKDDSLDPAPNESITCTGTYAIIQSDLDAGSVTDVATATVGTQISNTASAVIRIPENRVLEITVVASPTTYNAAGQQIKYSYTIKNTDVATLGPAQFIVRDDHFPDPIYCGTDQTTLATNQTVSCDAIYTTTADDAAASQIVNTARASGAGVRQIAPASATVTNSNINTGSSGTFTKGSTVQHNVQDGEWLMQIARCYGANIDATITANPQVLDPDLIFPAERVTVPNIGSVTGVHGPPCVTSYTVKSGDTWASIASDPNNNAAVDVLMEANHGISLTNGKIIRIPVNSRAYEGLSSVVTPVPAKQPIRINFPAGSPKVTLSGKIGTPETIRHVFTGAKGQILTVKLAVPTNDVSFAIYAPNGTATKPLNTDTSWSGTLDANGDYFIDLVSSLGSTTKDYSLEVTLTTPGPTSNVELVMDINAGNGSSNVSYLSVFNNLLYFQADRNDGAGPELWQYDSGLKAITRITDIPPGSVGLTPTFLTPFGVYLYFSANGNDGGGMELWRFNGNATGRATDINPLAADANPMYLTVFKDALYFSAKSNDGKGVELWKYDGTNDPTLVKDINPDAGDSNPAYLTEYKGALYFSATSNDGKGTELRKYDGNDVTLVYDLNPNIGNSNPAFLTVLNDAAGNAVLYFAANAGDGKGTELYKYDGTNVTLAYDINPTSDSVPTYLAAFKGNLYFSANGDNAGFELWKFDGTNASRVADINPAGNANPAYLAVYHDELYFQANDNSTGAELWKFKGP